MPWDEVPHKFKEGKLHSGGPGGPVVKDRSQMQAILMSEKRAAGKGKKEYAATKGLKDAGPKDDSKD